MFRFSVLLFQVEFPVSGPPLVPPVRYSLQNFFQQGPNSRILLVGSQYKNATKIENARKLAAFLLSFS